MIWYLLFNNMKELFYAPHKAEATHVAGLKIVIEKQSPQKNIKAFELIVW